MDVNRHLTLEKHVETQAVPKIKKQEDKERFIWMAQEMDKIGVDSYTLDAKEILELVEENKYTEQEWLSFLSDSIVAKFLEAQIIKLNAIALRKKIHKLSQSDNLSQADVKAIQILSDQVEKARETSDNTIQHFSTFVPTRWDYDNVLYSDEDKKIRDGKVQEIISLLEIDTDYTDVKSQQEEKQNLKKVREEEKKVAQKMEGIKMKPRTFEPQFRSK